MLKEENKIFKNLYNNLGWEINDAIKRAEIYSKAGRVDLSQRGEKEI